MKPKEKYIIYHYKDNGDWRPFSLPESRSEAWNNFCKALALKDPHDPHPYYNDYVDFLEQFQVKS